MNVITYPYPNPIKSVLVKGSNPVISYGVDCVDKPICFCFVFSYCFYFGFYFVCLYVCLFVCWLVGWLVGWWVGRFVFIVT